MKVKEGNHFTLPISKPSISEEELNKIRGLEVRNIPASVSDDDAKAFIEEKLNKFYSVERMRRHLYSFNSCILYTWVSLEALNNLYEIPIYKRNSPSLWFDL